MMTDEKTCPACAESVKAAANVCKHCGYDFKSGKRPAAPEKKSAAGKGCLIVLGVLAVLFVIGLFAGPAEKQAPTASAPAAPPRAVTAIELATAYDQNEAAAQKEYGDQRLAVSGTVSAIDLDFADKAVVRLKGTNQFMDVQASLSEASQGQAASLSKGQQVTLVCESVSEVVGTPMLRDCAI
jgi:hypothetical protein